MDCRVMIEKKHSTRFSQEQLVGVKCMVMRGFLASHAFTVGCLVSSRREFHPPALAEPYVTVSRHTAPTGRPAGGGRRCQWANSRGCHRRTVSSHALALAIFPRSRLNF